MGPSEISFSMKVIFLSLAVAFCEASASEDLQKRIEEQNTKFFGGQSEYSAGQSDISDLTESDFINHFDTIVLSDEFTSACSDWSVTNQKIPSSFDWRKHGIVTPVVNQGLIGSSVPITVTQSIAGSYALQNDLKLTPLSVEQVVDCHNVTNPTLDDTFGYAVKCGLENDDDYPISNKW